MEFYPYQMNQTLAAKYCGVSIVLFKKEYRPHIRKREKGGFIYFLKKDLEKYLRDLFNEKMTEPLPDPIRQEVETLKADPFAEALENLVHNVS